MGQYNHLYNTTRWRKLRRYILAHQSRCELCRKAGRITPATIVDHIKPHRGDIELFYNMDNLQAICKWHHDAHKQSLEKGGAGRYEIGADGMPLDIEHEWYN